MVNILEVIEMSNTLAKFVSNNEGNSKMYVTAFVGHKGDKSVQFTIGDDYFCMTSQQVEVLINILQKRLQEVEGYNPTESDLGLLVYPNGFVEYEKE